MLTKYIHNVSGSEILVFGQKLAAGANRVIPSHLYQEYAHKQHILDFISAGTVRLSFDGTNVLSEAASTSLLNVISPADKSWFDNSSNGFVADNVQAAIEEIDNAVIDDRILSRCFVAGGRIGNKWLFLEDSGGKASNEAPLPLPQAVRLTELGFTNRDSGSDIDIEIYKNGTAAGDKVFTWQIRDKQYAWKTNGLSAITFAQGDRIAIYAKTITNNAKPHSVVVTLDFKLTAENSAEGGA